MNIQEHLAAFDVWLTRRIDEAYAIRKDLAFRDIAAEQRLGDNAWEYCLLEPGGASPQGDGWSVYRLQGVWPQLAPPSVASPRARQPERKSLLGKITEALLGPDAAKRR